MTTSKFEAAAEKVQAHLQPEVVDPQKLDIGSMIEIGVMLLEIFSKCMDSSNGDAAQVANNIKSPTLFQRIMLRRAVRSHLGRNSQQRGERLERAILKAAGDADVQELLDLANETQDPTYY